MSALLDDHGSASEAIDGPLRHGSGLPCEAGLDEGARYLESGHAVRCEPDYSLERGDAAKVTRNQGPAFLVYIQRNAG